MVLGFNIFLTRNNGFHFLAGSRARGVFPALLRRTFCTSAVDNGGGGIQAAADDLKLVCEKDNRLAKIAVEMIRKFTSELEATSKKESDLARKLKSGFQTFKANVEKNPGLYGPLKEGQWPKYMVFACSDSRVCPSVVLDLKPGEAFVVRNVANIVPPYLAGNDSGVAAALAYAVLNLRVEHIIVMGHSRCGGIRGLMSTEEDDTPSADYVLPWLNICATASAKVLIDHKQLDFDQQCSHCEKEAINVSMLNLLTYPFVRDAVVMKTLSLKGAHYDFVDGSFKLWNFGFHVSPSVSA